MKRAVSFGSSVTLMLSYLTTPVKNARRRPVPTHAPAVPGLRPGEVRSGGGAGGDLEIREGFVPQDRSGRVSDVAPREFEEHWPQFSHISDHAEAGVRP